MKKVYDYRNCQSLFGYAASVHIRSAGICQLCGCGKGDEPDFDLWRQMTVEHIIGESQGGYLKQIRSTLSGRFPDLPSDELEEFAKQIDELNTVSACSFCNSTTSRFHSDIGMTDLIKNTKGKPETVIEIISKKTEEILEEKRSVVKWKLSSIIKFRTFLKCKDRQNDLSLAFMLFYHLRSFFRKWH